MYAKTKYSDIQYISHKSNALKEMEPNIAIKPMRKNSRISLAGISHPGFHDLIILGQEKQGAG
jgi:hypothetical protein